MGAGTFFLLLLGIALVVVAAVFVFAWAQGRAPRALTRSERLRLERSEELIDKLKELAYENRSDTSLVPDIFIQEIKDYETENRRKGISS